MSTRLSKEDAFSITDSTDWLETPLASLTPIDSALRCQVCKDFYTTPMITSCSHTFCSLCIRRCLSNDGQCPACRAKDQELKLRLNGAMEELVQAFVKARPDIMAVAVAKKTEEKGNASPKRRREKVEEDEEDGPRKRTRSSGRNLQSSQRVIVVDSEDDIDDYIPEGYVHCPICQKEVKEDLINTHLDRGCQDESTTKSRKPPTTVKPQFPPKPSKPLERLAPPNYSMLKDAPLRKKLTDHGLSAAGNRQLLIQRHTEWTTLWNANCDATKPKSKMELKREMDIWERTQGGGQARASGMNHASSGAQIRDKDFDGMAWSNKHDGDFRNLIRDARKKIVKTAPVREEAEMEAEAENVDATTPTSGLTTDTEMGNSAEDATANPPASLPLREPSSFEEGTFFQENGEETFNPPSSQHRNKSKNNISVENIATSRPIEP